MEKPKKVEPKTLRQGTEPAPSQDNELDDTELDKVNGGTKRTGGSWYLAIAKALGEAESKAANK